MPFADRDVLKLAFEELGGRARLKRHYAQAIRLCRERGLECPTEEHVRITIYNYTPGRKSYLHNGDFFAIVGPGEYRVATYSRRYCIARSILILSGALPFRILKRLHPQLELGPRRVLQALD